jgi:branched-chain amino acid aminotransferase
MTHTAPAADAIEPWHAPATPANSRAKKIWLDGRLVNPDEARISVFDHGLLYGDGVFEGIRIYHNRIFKLRTHLIRLFESARHLDLTIPYSIEQLTQACRDAVAANDMANGYIRLCVTRGVGPLGLSPASCARPSVFIIVDQIALYAPEIYESGMAIITAATIRNHPAALSPRIKSMNYLNNILAKIEAAQAKVSEAIMLNHLGFVSECTADNIFIVARDHGQPYIATPPLHAGVLEGVTRNTIIDLAEQAGYTVRQPDLTRHDLFTAEEVFLTGTGAEVVPVVRIDSRTIGSGTPGPITRSLIAAFRKYVENPTED